MGGGLRNLVGIRLNVLGLGASAVISGHLFGVRATRPLLGDVAASRVGHARSGSTAVISTDKRVDVRKLFGLIGSPLLQ